MPSEPLTKFLPPEDAPAFGPPRSVRRGPGRTGGLVRRLVAGTLLGSLLGGAAQAALGLAVLAVPLAVVGSLWLAPAAANDALPAGVGGFDPGVFLRWGGGMVNAAVEATTGAGE